MDSMELFLSARLDENEAAIKSRDLNLPIHYVGCYYYDNSFDAGLRCDCDEDGRASAFFLAEIKAKREVIECLTQPDRALLVAILSVPYSDHPDYPGKSQGLQGL